MILTDKETELIQGLRNLRNSTHNPSLELEWYLDTIYQDLKERETADD